LSAQGAANGSVAATGHLTISGAITDKGRVTDYRASKGHKDLTRRVVVGKDGTITFLITLYSGVQRWTITSATNSYKGLHGTGAQTADNTGSTPATFTLAGTVSH
jgi:hypothetical protein